MEAILHALSSHVGVLGCVATYVMFIVLFASIYYGLYQKRSVSFAVSTSVLPAQRDAYKIRQRKGRLVALASISLYQELSAKLDNDGQDPRSLADQKYVASLPSIKSTARLYVQDKSNKGAQAIRVDLYDERETKFATTSIQQPWIWMSWRQALEAGKKKCIRQRNEHQKRLDRVGNIDAPVFGFFDFLYFSAICQTTVGFGDILPNSTAVRLIVVLQVIIGIFIAVFALALLAP